MSYETNLRGKAHFSYSSQLVALEGGLVLGWLHTRLESQRSHPRVYSIIPNSCYINKSACVDRPVFYKSLRTLSYASQVSYLSRISAVDTSEWLGHSFSSRIQESIARLEASLSSSGFNKVHRGINVGRFMASGSCT